MKNEQDSKKPLIQSVERALDILEILESSNENLRSIDIAEKLGLNSNTASNLIRTLYDRGYLSQDESRRYKLGARCCHLGKCADKWGYLREKAIPVMREVSEATGESTFLGALENFRLLCVEMVEGNGFIRVSKEQVWNDKVHCSASGKVLLAFLTEKEKESFFKKEKLVSYTKKTIADEKSLRNEFLKIKEQGFAVCQEEASNEISAVGVPVFDGDGKVAASIAQSFPSYFIESGKIKFTERAELLKKASSKILI